MIFCSCSFAQELPTAKQTEEKLMRLLFISLLVFFSITGAAFADQHLTDVVIDVYKSPGWGCCKGWGDHLEKSGFKVRYKDIKRISDLKKKSGVPDNLRSCHTAIVGGYVIEGHVPVEQIARLLQIKPDIVGIAVPGMPIGSPGMESDTIPPQPYQVIAFDKQGRTGIFATYPK